MLEGELQKRARLQQPAQALKAIMLAKRDAQRIRLGSRTAKLLQVRAAELKKLVCRLDTWGSTAALMTSIACALPKQVQLALQTCTARLTA